MWDELLTGKNCFVFPGIGVRLFGGEGSFFSHFDEVIRPFLREAAIGVREDLIAALNRDEINTLPHQTVEIFTYAFNYGVFTVYRQLGLTPFCLAGHSMGVYAALAASGAISFTGGLNITRAASQFGRQHCPPGSYGAGVIVGLDRQEAELLIKELALTSVLPVNSNNQTSTVFAGYKKEIEALLAAAEDYGAVKSILLAIDIPYHNPFFMQEAADRLRQFLATIDWQPPRWPILSALDHTLLTTVEELQEMTTANLAYPICWQGVLKSLRDHDVHRVLECGPGISLTQHARLVPSAPRHYNLKNLRRRLGYS